ncbi:hypothetical protein F3J37_21715 [Pantoea sp. Al-1710]|uniref:Uncharacterized protein n=1 Tax=Candidatus Pantoea communis TaxID=2608354 RepID=A0ABX0RZQ6_9GAMM|nr:hypothetical protein [Pantoea communis]NIG21294.1 hypothetical protein [Pantoea communis]
MFPYKAPLRIKTIFQGLILLSMVKLTTFNVSASPLLLLEVAETVSNVNHFSEGIKRVNAIYDSTEILKLLTQVNEVPGPYYFKLEQYYIDYMKKGPQWIQKFYLDEGIPKNIYMKEIPPLEETSRDMKSFAYIVTGLNKDSCDMVHKALKNSFHYEYINQGGRINTSIKRKGECKDIDDNEIIVLR